VIGEDSESSTRGFNRRPSTLTAKAIHGVVMQVETKLLRLFKRAALGDRFGGWRVCWIGGWDKCRVLSS
jgi:hypothetical protein